MSRREGWPPDTSAPVGWSRLPVTLIFTLGLVLMPTVPLRSAPVPPPPAPGLARPPGATATGADTTTESQSAAQEVGVQIRAVDERGFPDIHLEFEVRKPDGSALLDAAARDFTVRESGQVVPFRDFVAPMSTEVRPTSVVLVIDRSRSMIEDEDRMTPLKAAVRTFLEVMPKGSEVAIVVFSSRVEVAQPLTKDLDAVRDAVAEIEPFGNTRFYDAVERALSILADTPGRRAVLALTDGEDTASRESSLESVIRRSQAIGVPVYTLGVGSEEAIATDDLARLAKETRARYFNARQASELRAIYEEVARRLGEAYTLTYTTDRKLPDGTLRPVEIFYQHATKPSGATSIFVRGMVVPASGWDRLFVVLLVGLVAALAAPRWRPKPRVGQGA